MTQTSREYAEALFELALESGNVEEVAAGVKTVEEELAENPEFLSLLSSPAISRKERMNALNAAFEGKVPLTVLTLERMMIFRGHAKEIPEMGDAFRDMVMASRGEKVARVVSAVEMTDEQKRTLAEKLGAKFGGTVKLECRVDPALLGGVRVEMDGRVLDGSVRTRLQEIKEVMGK